jgi:methylamine---glutamate N-methyltransferase subunit B
VRGTVASLGADCVAKPMRSEHLTELKALLHAAGLGLDPSEFTRYGSARKLYNFHVDNASAY